MTPELYCATLNPSGPNYATWFAIFGPGPISVKSAVPILINLGEETDVEVYILDLAKMTSDQRIKLLYAVAQKFGKPLREVALELVSKGFPIRAVDVTVAISMRAVL